MRSWRIVARACLALAVFAVPFIQMPVALADTVNATLVRTLFANTWTPASPDPAGVTYMPGVDQMVYADSEVDETTGAGYHGVNVWQRTRTTDAHVRTWTTLAYSPEPTGLGFDPGTGRLFITSDSGEKLFVILPGNDGLYGSSDDVRTTILLEPFGITDSEDVAFNTANGHVYIADGSPVEIWDLNPVDGILGNGNDTATHWDAYVLGVRDAEGLGYDPVRNTLLIADRTTRDIYETTASGSLVRKIDTGGISGLQNPSDVEVAPASNGSGLRNYWLTDRTVDNGTDSNENDGLIWEISIPSGGDTPPTVTLTSPAEGAEVSGTSVALAATASDNLGVTRVDWFLDGGSNPIASDTSSAGGWTATWSSTGTSDGAHTIRAQATDTIGQTASDTNAITIDNVDSAPSVTLTAPAEGATVTGTSVALAATAGDDEGVTRVDWYLDGGSSPIASDTSVAGGWTASWNSEQTNDGAHTITARATDTIGQTGSDSNGVTVENDTPPVVTLVSPADGATVAGDAVLLEASVTDDGTVQQVQFMLDGFTTIGADSDGSDGWKVTWDSESTQDGPHTISAIATDDAAQTGTDEHDVTVDNIDVVPTVTLTAPAAGATIGGSSVSLAAAATDDRGVTRVDWYLDADLTTPIASDTSSTGGWTATWNASGVGDGTHTITARATDTGNQTDDDAHAVTVDNTAPTGVAITSPAAGATVEGTVTVTASASGATSVEFFRGATGLGTDTNGGDGWSVAWNTVTVPNGQHTLTAVARDQVGNQATSGGVTVTVDNPLVLDVPVSAGTDDAEQKPNRNVVTTSDDIDMLTDNNVTYVAAGIRFAGVNLPAGAVVTNAYIQFTADEAYNVATTLRLEGERSANPPTFAVQKSNITNRARTTAQVGWSSPGWTVVNARTEAQRTPNLAPILNEIIGLAGWAPGNAVAFIITPNPGGRLVADSFDGGGAANGPVLHIEYEL